MTHFNIINNLYLAFSHGHLILIQHLTLMITSFRRNLIWVNSKQLGALICSLFMIAFLPLQVPLLVYV